MQSLFPILQYSAPWKARRKSDPVLRKQNVIQGIKLLGTAQDINQAQPLV